MHHKNCFWGILRFCVLAVAGFVFPFGSWAEDPKNTVEHETGFYYTIQKGDTLWDISKRFFDSPSLWPDLWNENNQIPNPHWIYPGERIRLFHKKGVAEIEPENKMEAEKQPLPKKEPPYYLYTSMDSIGFIRKEPVTSSGFIFKVKEDKTMISQGDTVYIKPTQGSPLAPGSKYTVFRTLTPIKEEKAQTDIGVQYYLTGIAEITRQEPDFSVARIVQSFRPIEINDRLMPYMQRSPKVTLTESKKGLLGKIIVSEEHKSIFGDHTVVFIDKGEKDGVASGQQYSVFYQEKKRITPESKEEVLLPPVDYGALLVLHAEQTTSTVLITRSDKNIEPGATICTPFP